MNTPGLCMHMVNYVHPHNNILVCVCVNVCACVRACMRACVRMCVCACVRVRVRVTVGQLRVHVYLYFCHVCISVPYGAPTHTCEFIAYLFFTCQYGLQTKCWRVSMDMSHLYMLSSVNKCVCNM